MVKNKSLLFQFLTLVIFVVLGPLISTAIFFTVEQPQNRDAIRIEAAKSFVQFSVIVVLGALVKFTFDQVSEYQRKQQEYLEGKRKLIRRLSKINNSILKIPYNIEKENDPIDAYNREMRVLFDISMEISDFGRDAEIYGLIHPYNERIGIHILFMQTFVYKVLEEYKKEVDSLEQLSEYQSYKKSVLDFIEKGNASSRFSRYNVDYRDHYFRIRKELSFVVTESHSPKWDQTEGKLLSFERQRYEYARDTNSYRQAFEYEHDSDQSSIYVVTFECLYYVKKKRMTLKDNFSSYNSEMINDIYRSLSSNGDKVNVYYDRFKPSVSVMELQ